MSAYILYGAAIGAAACSIWYAIRVRQLNEQIRFLARKRDFWQEMYTALGKKSEVRNAYRAKLSYYHPHPCGGLRADPAFSKPIDFTVSLPTPYEFPDREIKKIYGSKLIDSVPKRLLANGELRVEQIQYLGQVKEVAGGVV